MAAMLLEWMPTSGSSRGRLVRAALAAFGTRPFDQVGVADLAAEADTTTGPLYHHFGSKLGLYVVVREDVERRVVDRLEGFLDARDSSERRAVVDALAAAFDYLVRADLAAMLADPHPEPGRDLVVDALARTLGPGHEPLAELVAAAWRAALAMVVRGGDPDAVRSSLTMLSIVPTDDPVAAPA